MFKRSTLQRMLLAGAIIPLALSSPVEAQTPGAIPGLAAKIAQQKASAKVGGALLQLEKEFTTHHSAKGAGARGAAFKPSNGLVQVRPGNYVVVDAVAENDAKALEAELQTLGAKNTSVYGRVVSALVPIQAMPRLAAVKSLRFVRASPKPITNSGFVTSQGDTAQRSHLARSAYHVNGKGVTIGVLSDSYNNQTGAKVGVLSGELPGVGNPNGFMTPVSVLSDLAEGGTDEGRGMLEILHDVAPGSQLAFHTAFNGEADFALGIIKLRLAGSHVITDDVSYLNEPFFQDGIIAQAVNAVVQDGATYFSSAGNQGRQSYEASFGEGGPTIPDVGQAHVFGPGDILQNVTIPAGSDITLAFQWSDPFYSVSGGMGAQTDMDIYLLDSTGTKILASSAQPNIGSDPWEILQYVNEGAKAIKANILLVRYEGPAPKLLKYVDFGSAIVNEHHTFSATNTGHSNAEHAIATAAARYDRTPAYGVNPPRVESFSSAGGTPILFDMYGNAIAPLVRKKPEITSIDGGNTSFFFPGFDYEGDGFSNFFGTSAAAPHAAGVAALMLEATKHALSPSQVLTALESTAIDMNDPFTPAFDLGFDYATGYGLIQADAALSSVYSAPILTSFSLIDADTDKEIAVLPEGAVINLALLSTKNLNIRANVLKPNVGSVVFQFQGKQRIENVAPYALGGDSNGNYQPLAPALKPGNYVLQATPYSSPGGNGVKGVGLTLRFSVVESQVASLILVNADSDKDLGEIQDGSTIDLAALPTKNLNIRAATIPATVGSVVFRLDGNVTVENQAPYAAGGDYLGNYFALKPALTPGLHSLTSTSYAKRNGGGEAGGALKVRFLIEDTSVPASARQGDDVALANTLTAQPNPFAGSTSVQFKLESTQTASLQVFDAQGRLVQTLYQGLAEGGKVYNYELDGNQWTDGVYITRLATGKKISHLKLVLTK